MNKLKLFLIILLSVFVKPVLANTSEEVKYLAMAIFYEAQGESHAGKEAVADVILNRVDHPEFANSVKKVITSRGQFQWYYNRSLRGGRVFNPNKEKEIMKLAKKKYMQHVMDVRKDTTKKAIFFSTGRKPAPRARLIKKVGSHYLFALKSKTQRS
nr:MAG TPA: Cell Wall Hydrolase [Caudoviricetes sp.]